VVYWDKNLIIVIGAQYNEPKWAANYCFNKK
jgi:hypothetical protein